MPPRNPRKQRRRNRHARAQSHAHPGVAAPPPSRHSLGASKWRWRENHLGILLCALFAYIIIALAWLADDSLISLRQSWNFVNGAGFTFNFDQRVQAFTHPTWMVLLTALIFVTGELFYTTFFISIVLSLLAVWSIVVFHNRLAAQKNSAQKNSRTLLVVLLSLAFSKAFMDYTTSGLENPLSYCLVGVLMCLAATLHNNSSDNTLPDNNSRHSTAHLALMFVVLAGLFLNRFDYAILVLPAALYLFFCTTTVPQAIKAVLPAIAIVLAWFIFSTIYFGSPMPNTYYAKLGADIPTAQLYSNGWTYYRITFTEDPTSGLLLIGGVVSGFLSRRRLYQSLSLGIVLYCAYILHIGGDFMLGRFFSLPVYLSAFILIAHFVARAPDDQVGDAKRKGKRRHKKAVNIGKLPLAVLWLAALLAVQNNRAPLVNTFKEGPVRNFEGIIVTEREFNSFSNGLLSPHRNFPQPTEPPSVKPTRYNVGFLSGRNGLSDLDRYWIDFMALTDAFLSRLPAVRQPNLTTGHAGRVPPPGYPEYLLHGTPIENQSLRGLLADVTQAISGDLFDAARWRAIWRLNVSKPYQLQLQHLQIDYANINHTARPNFAKWDLPGNVFFGNQADITFAQPISARELSLSLSVDNSARYAVFVNDAPLAKQPWKQIHRERSGREINGLVTYRIPFNSSREVHKVTVKVTNAQFGVHSIGHLKLN